MGEVYYNNLPCCFRKTQATFTHGMARVPSTELLGGCPDKLRRSEEFISNIRLTNVLFGRVRTVGIGPFTTMIEGRRKQEYALET